MNFDGIGNEQGGLRPGLVFQNNLGNLYSPNIIALPLTTAKKKIYQPTHVLLLASETGLKQDSMVLCENPQRMAKDRIGKYLTTLTLEQLSKVAEANILASSAIAFINPDLLLGIWQKASLLNANACLVSE